VPTAEYLATLEASLTQETADHFFTYILSLGDVSQGELNRFPQGDAMKRAMSASNPVKTFFEACKLWEIKTDESGRRVIQSNGEYEIVRSKVFNLRKHVFVKDGKFIMYRPSLVALLKEWSDTECIDIKSCDDALKHYMGKNPSCLTLHKEARNVPKAAKAQLAKEGVTAVRVNSYYVPESWLPPPPGAVIPSIVHTPLRLPPQGAVIPSIVRTPLRLPPQ
jgi:hypothetical protein